MSTPFYINLLIIRSYYLKHKAFEKYKYNVFIYFKFMLQYNHSLEKGCMLCYIQLKQLLHH